MDPNKTADNMTVINVRQEADEILQYLEKISAKPVNYDAFGEKPVIAKHKLARAKAKKAKRKTGGKR